VFLYGLTHGFDFLRSGEMASLAASKLVTQHGPRLDKDSLLAAIG